MRMMIVVLPEDVETRMLREMEERQRKHRAENPYYPYVWGQKI